MKNINLPARGDPCWEDADWRAAKLRECVERHGLDRAAVADLTGNRIDTVRIWIAGYGAVIGVNTLRALILELNARSV